MSVYCNVLQDAVRCSALRAACFQGCIDVAQVLLEHGAVVDYQDNVIEYSQFSYNSITILCATPVL